MEERVQDDDMAAVRGSRRVEAADVRRAEEVVADTAEDKIELPTDDAWRQANMVVEVADKRWIG